MKSFLKIVLGTLLGLGAGLGVSIAWAAVFAISEIYLIDQGINVSPSVEALANVMIYVFLIGGSILGAIQTYKKVKKEKYENLPLPPKKPDGHF